MAALLFQQAADPEWGSLFAALPWLVCLAGAAIAWRFRSGNMVMVFVALAAVHGLLEQGGRSPYTAETLRLGAAWYWPVMVACLATLPERGLFNRPGLERVAFIVYPALIILAHAANGQPTPSWLRSILFDGVFLSLRLPDAALVFAIGAGGALIGLSRRRATPLESGLLTALLLGMIGLALGDNRVVRAAYFSTAGAALIVALIQNSYRVAFHDELTGLPGRRALKSLLNTVGERYVIAMLDVDHFKKFNDTYGHDVGDQVLCRVGRVIANVTGGGQYFRYGGEEFTIVFPNRSLRDALPHLDAVCAAMAATPFTVRSKDRPETKPEAAQDRDAAKAPATQVTITISIGAAEKSPRYADWEAVMKAADQALYRAKQAGRNRVMADGQK